MVLLTNTSNFCKNSKIVSEREKRFKRKSIVNHVKRFFDSKKEALQAIDEVIENEDIDYDTGRLFFELSSGKGAGKSHASGKNQGELKNS